MVFEKKKKFGKKIKNPKSFFLSNEYEGITETKFETGHISKTNTWFSNEQIILFKNETGAIQRALQTEGWTKKNFFF